MRPEEGKRLEEGMTPKEGKRLEDRTRSGGKILEEGMSGIGYET